MKKTTILYWVFTGLFAAFMLFSALPDVFSAKDAVKVIHEDLGYPLYFLPFIGILKVLGAITILVPGYPRIKEWAYAGLCFDLIGATYSIIASGQPAGAAFMILPLMLALLSYTFYHRRLAAKTKEAGTQGSRLYNNATETTSFA